MRKRCHIPPGLQDKHGNSQQGGSIDEPALASDDSEHAVLFPQMIKQIELRAEGIRSAENGVLAVVFSQVPRRREQR